MFPQRINKELKELDYLISGLEQNFKENCLDKNKKMLNKNLKSPPTKLSAKKPFVTCPVKSKPTKVVKKSSSMSNTYTKSSLSYSSFNNPQVAKDTKPNKEKILHKEVLANPGGTIEVTVKSKPPDARTINAIKEVKESSSELSSKCESCPCARIRSESVIEEHDRRDKSRRSRSRSRSGSRPTWCDVLSNRLVDGVEAGDKSYRQTRYSSNRPGSRNDEERVSSRHKDCFTETPPMSRGEVRERVNHFTPSKQKKLSKKQTKSKTDATDNLNLIDKDVQCYMYEGDFVFEPNPLKSLNFAIKELKSIASSAKNPSISRIINGMERTLAKVGDNNKSSNESVVVIRSQNLGDKKKLESENQHLREELNVKNKIITDLNKKEKEYVSLIASLQNNLEIVTKQAQDSTKVMRDITDTNKKLSCEIEKLKLVTEAHDQLALQINDLILDNDKLKSVLRLKEIKMQKYKVLLDAKESNTRSIQDKFDAMEKYIFNCLSKAPKFDENVLSNILKDINDLSRSESEQSGDNVKLMHSSPTSSKCGDLVDNSWNCISSIKGEDKDKNVVVLTAVNDKMTVDESVDNFFKEHSSNEDCGKLLRNYLNQLQESDNSFVTVKETADIAILDKPKEINFKTNEAFKNNFMKCNNGFTELKQRMAQRILDINPAKTFAEMSQYSSLSNTDRPTQN